MLKRPLAVAAWQAGAAAWLGELLVRIEEGLREQLITELESAQAEGLRKPMLLSSVEGRGREVCAIECGSHELAYGRPHLLTKWCHASSDLFISRLNSSYPEHLICRHV